ncbi:hypothetical protein RhiirA4_430989 [Rhizophagus irregularis]|uniref:DUF659 domain-containing protein n=1 Tax=Rhizophagus irregularis TaxID=588596 RepID=A0A2I1HN02_9GLOM|nr:hypothetical protein RhiirA4_430989 [Rhizophagus irregularis]
MIVAKKLVNKKYPHVIPVRCITYHINLLTNDIMKHKFSKSTISKCMKIVKYFYQSYKVGATLLEDIQKNLVDGGNLKGYCKTHWTTAFDCLASILRCERSLHNVLENYPETLNDEIKTLLHNQIFYQDVEKLVKIIKPIKEVLTSLEFKTTTLSDCFIQLMKLRGKELKDGVFRQIVYWSIEILINSVDGEKIRLKALEVEVRVVIEKEADPSYDHGEKLFDIDDLVNSTLGN